MKTQKLMALVFSALFALSITAAPGLALIVTQEFDVPPGIQQLVFHTGATEPLSNVRIIMGGRPDVTTSAIVGLQDNQNMQFSPPATPFEVTQFYEDHPIATSQDSDFLFVVQNPTSDTIRIHIGLVSD